MSERHTRHHGPGRGMGEAEKPKDFRKAIKKIFTYMKRYRLRLGVMFLCAIAGTVFAILGPKILGSATTELFNGLVAKVQGTGGIDFARIGQILLSVMGLHGAGVGDDRNFQRCQL